MTADNLKNISPKDGFVVVAKNLLTNTELRGLMDLYVPMMGAGAYGVYVLLNRYGGVSPNLVKRSMNKELLLGLSVGMRDFLESREKLEALGLLRTFEKNDRLGKLSIYYIQRPLLGDNFFNDDLLSTLLLETIGQGSFRRLKETYCPRQFKVEGSTEVTKSFLDVFPIQQSTLLKNSAHHHVEPQNKSSQQLIEKNETDLDLKFLKQLLAKSFVPESEIFNNLDAIKTLHLLYGLDELQLVRLSEEAIDISNNKLNIKYLKRLAHSSFEFEMRPTQPKKDEENKKEVSKKTEAKLAPTKADAELVRVCKALLPLEFLHTIKAEANSITTSSEKYMITNLVSQQLLPNEVINVLIHYILSDRGYASMKRDYFEATAARWSTEGIKTAEQAMYEVRKSVAEGKKKQANYHSKTSYRKKRPVVQKEQLPDWAQNDYQTPENTKEQTDKKANWQAEIKRRLAEIDHDN